MPASALFHLLGMVSACVADVGAVWCSIRTAPLSSNVNVLATDAELQGEFYTRFQQMLAHQKPSIHLSYVTNSLARLKIDLTPENLDEAERGAIRSIDLAHDQTKRLNLLQAFAICGHSPGAFCSGQS